MRLRPDGGEDQATQPPSGAAGNCKGLLNMICPVSAGGTSSQVRVPSRRGSEARTKAGHGRWARDADGVLEDAEMPSRRCPHPLPSPCRRKFKVKVAPIDTQLSRPTFAWFRAVRICEAFLSR